MDKHNGIREIAKRANVSIATVDRVIHNRGNVAIKTKERIVQIMKEINFQPNLLASRLASKKKINFVTVTPKLTDETNYWETPINGIKKAEQELSQYGIQVDKYFFESNNASSYIEKMNEVLSRKIDGLLLIPSFIRESLDFLYTLDKRAIPYVLINSDISDCQRLSYIGADIKRIGSVAAQLIHYALNGKGTIVIIHISNDIVNKQLQNLKGEGFIDFFQMLPAAQNSYQIVTIEINNTRNDFIEQELNVLFRKVKNIKAIYVSNSRSSHIARFLVKRNAENIIVIGQDFLKENVEYLKTGTIDFLICTRPEESAYKGIMALYKHTLLDAKISPTQYMPLDILSKENYLYYKD